MEPQQVQTIREADLGSAPMPQEHRERVAGHIGRLWKTVNNPNERKIPGYTNKSAAREQLAYMTVVFRDRMSRYQQSKPEDATLIFDYYLSKCERGRLEDAAVISHDDRFSLKTALRCFLYAVRSPCYKLYAHTHAIHFRLTSSNEVESMVVDMVDASFYISDHTSSLPAIGCNNSMMFGREQEMERFVQEIIVESTDVVVELHNAEKSEGDRENTKNVGKDIDLTTVLRRYRSDADIVHRWKKDFTPEVRPEWDYRLRKRSKRQLNPTWPPPTDVGIQEPPMTSELNEID
jgi:hypothetical protein